MELVEAVSAKANVNEAQGEPIRTKGEAVVRHGNGHPLNGLASQAHANPTVWQSVAHDRALVLPGYHSSDAQQLLDVLNVPTGEELIEEPATAVTTACSGTPR